MTAITVSLGLLLIAPLSAVTPRYGAAAAALLIAAGAFGISVSGPPSATVFALPVIGTVGFTTSDLAGLFTLVTAGVFIVALPFIAHDAARLSPGPRAAFMGMLALTFAAMAGVFHAADVVAFVFCWEIAALAIWGLIGFESARPEPVAAGILTVGLSEVGSLAGLVGLLLLALSAGDTTLDGIAVSAARLPSSVIVTACTLTFFGFGMKAGIIPLNLWLPPAHANAPRSISPVLSGATLNLGLFAFLRIDGPLAITHTGLGLMMLVTGALTALVGMVYAMSEHDMKRLLAQSSIENIGITTAAFGAGLAFAALDHPVPAGMALIAGLYHMLNHSVFKTMLFIGAGGIDDATGTHDLNRLGGLMRRLPLFGVLFLVGALSIAALPPFNGFVSEWLTLESLLRVVEVSPVPVRITFAVSGAALALTAGLALTCFTMLAGTTLLGLARSGGAARPGIMPFSVTLPMGLLALVCLVMGLAATVIIPGLGPLVAPLAGVDAAPQLVPSFFDTARELPVAIASDLAHIGARIGAGWLPLRGLVVLHSGGSGTPVVFAMSTALSAVVICLILLTVWIIARVMRHAVPRVGALWDAGLAGVRPEMAYNATAFASPVRVLFDGVFSPVVTSEEQHLGVFVTANRYRADATHVVERLAIRPFARFAQSLSGILARLHQGQVTAYAGYVLFALLATLLISRTLL